MTIEPAKPATETGFDRLLEYLKLNRGFDFTGYKPSSLQRRILKRMHERGVEAFDEYIDYLEVHPDEFRDLFNTVCINVTGFFRDTASWQYVSEEVVPALLAELGDDEPVRVWSAGCASGEEAYTMAIVLAEALGDEAFLDRVKIYATDVDEDALTQARVGAYASDAFDEVPEAIVARYFERSGSALTFRKDLRRAVIFGRNDLVQDAPISRIDLLVCRNTLMYFNAETQTRILRHFHFSLNDRGALFLGKSEMLITRADMFTPVSRKERVFQKVARSSLRDRLVFVAPDRDGDGRRDGEGDGNGDGHRDGSGDGDRDGDGASNVAGLLNLREGSFDAAPVAQIVVDRGGQLALANERARALFGLAPSDVGRPLSDLELSYRPADLRSALDAAQQSRKPVALGVVKWSFGDVEHQTEVLATPLLGAGGALIGSSVTFADVAVYERMRKELERSTRELGMAYEELQSTVEELETTNEELQSTNEELETTNEELQSTNEELETMNEELQSTNEELETINEELGDRSDDLDRVNAFLETILLSLGVAVAVVDRDQAVQVWNARAGDLWGLRTDEVVGQHLLSLDIGLPVEELGKPLRDCLVGSAESVELTLEAINRRGRAIAVEITCMPLVVPGKEPAGVIVLMEELRRGA